MDDTASLTSAYFHGLAHSLGLPMRFRGRSREDWQEWRRQWARCLRRLMGPPPESPELAVRELETVEAPDHVRRKILYNSEANVWVPAWLLIPRGAPPDGKRPAVLCAHGHGLNGKDNVAGVRNATGSAEEIERYNYDYGLKLVRMGFVVIAPDWRSFGERIAYTASRSGRDWCESHGNCASLFGHNLLALNVNDARRAIDVLETLETVDRRRIGGVGFSYGGRLMTFVSALDRRVKATVISGALNTFADRVLINLGSCGSQIVHGLLRYGDMPEVAGLVAPRHLFFEKGAQDPEPSSEDYYERVRQVYTAAAARQRLGLRVFEGGHVFEGKHSLPWLQQCL